MTANSEARSCHTLVGEWSEPGAALTAPALDNPRMRGVVMSDPTPDQIRVDRFWSKVDRSKGPDECWPWLGRLNASGYGTFAATGVGSRGAHRVAYILNVGPIPDGLQLDHLCRVRHCVNPRHLEPVTLAENLRRGAEARRTTHCPNGHEWTPETTCIGSHGYRLCKVCKVQRTQRVRERRRLVRAALKRATGSSTRVEVDRFIAAAKAAGLRIVVAPQAAVINKDKTHCIRGHDLSDPDVVSLSKDGRRRTCRVCVRMLANGEAEASW